MWVTWYFLRWEPLWERWFVKPENNHMTVRARRHDFHTGRARRWYLGVCTARLARHRHSRILPTSHPYSAVLQQSAFASEL